jgi:hypothetical protein
MFCFQLSKRLVQKTKSPSGVIFLTKLDMDKDPNLPQEVLIFLMNLKSCFQRTYQVSYLQHKELNMQ